MDKPLSAPAIFAALSTIWLDKWRCRGTMVSYLGMCVAGQDPGEWIEVSHREVSEATGMGLGYVGKLFRSMVSEGVLIRDPGAGRRSDAYALNSNLRSWNGVPWRLDQRTAAYVVEIVNEELMYAAPPPVARAAMERAQIPVARAAMERAQAIRCARSIAARATPANDGRSARSIEPRATENPRALLWSARNQEPARGAWQRAQTPPPAEASPYIGFKEEEEEEKQSMLRVVAAIQAASGKQVFVGQLTSDISAVLRGALCETDVLAVIDSAPPRPGGGRWDPPQFVAMIKARAEGIPPLPPQPDQGPSDQPAPPPSYVGWDDPGRWALPETGPTRPPAAVSLLGRSNGCQNGHEQRKGET